MEITYSRADLERLMLDDAGVRPDELIEAAWGSAGSLTLRFSVLASSRDARQRGGPAARLKEETMTGRELLLIPMSGNDANAATVGGYLQAILRQVWKRGEGFGSKRPFGNSGWAHELYKPLIAAGAVEGGSLDPRGYVEQKGDADKVVFDAIDALFCEPADDEVRQVTIAALRAEIVRLERSRPD